VGLVGGSQKGRRPLAKQKVNEATYITYLTYDDLKRINASSVKAGRNRNLDFEQVPIKDDGTRYPVASAFNHNDEEMRTHITLNPVGDIAVLDMSFEEFSKLKVSVVQSVQQDIGHDTKCDYCGGNYACNCEWSDGEHMCPRCDFDSEELKRLGTCHGYGSSSKLIRTSEE
jgi:hypothetical protein